MLHADIDSAHILKKCRICLSSKLILQESAFPPRCNSRFLVGCSRIGMATFEFGKDKPLSAELQMLNQGVIQTYLMCQSKRNSIVSGSATIVTKKNCTIENCSKLMRWKSLRMKRRNSE